MAVFLSVHKVLKRKNKIASLHHVQPSNTALSSSLYYQDSSRRESYSLPVNFWRYFSLACDQYLIHLLPIHTELTHPVTCFQPSSYFIYLQYLTPSSWIFPYFLVEWGSRSPVMPTSGLQQQQKSSVSYIIFQCITVICMGKNEIYLLSVTGF